jgi:hypothetical protein
LDNPILLVTIRKFKRVVPLIHEMIHEKALTAIKIESIIICFRFEVRG